MATVLSTYRTQVRRILHDNQGSFYTDVEVNDAINESRGMVVADTGCLRTLQIIYLNVNQEAYPFGTVTGTSILTPGTGYATPPTVAFTGGGGSGAAGVANITLGAVVSITLTNPGSGYTSAPTITLTGGGGTGATAAAGVISLNTLDVLGVSAIWGFTRYALDWKTFSEFSALTRFWTNWQQMPALWSIYGESTVYISPLPDQNYTCEVDTILQPADLVDDTSIESIARAYQGPVKYYAAYILKLKEQSFGEAELFKSFYQSRVREVVSQVFTRRIPSLYDEGGI